MKIKVNFYVLVRTKDFKVLFISSRFQEVFHIAKERIVVDFMVLKKWWRKEFIVIL